MYPAGPGVSESVANSLSDRIVETIGAEGTAAPLTNQQIVFIRNMIQETLEDLRWVLVPDFVILLIGA